MRRLLALLVLASFAASMAWRVQRDCLPRWREASKTSYRSALRGKLPMKECFRLSAGGRTVGDLLTSADRKDDGSIAMKEVLKLDAQALVEAWPFLSVLGSRLTGAEGAIVMTTVIEVSTDYRLAGLSLDARLGDLRLRGTGRMEPGGMQVVLNLGGAAGFSQSVLVPMDPDRPLLMGLSFLGVVPDLPLGSRWEIQVFNPLSLKSETLKAKLSGLDLLEMGGRKVSARLIEIRHRTFGDIRVWLDAESHVLRQTAFGLTMERVEDPGVGP
jgi:hypothetical protein